MSYDMFDDAAFYWFAVMVLILFLFMPTFRVFFPKDRDRTAIKRNTPIIQSPTSKVVKNACSCDGCRTKMHHLQAEQKGTAYKEWLTFGSFVFIGLWILLIYLLVQMPNYMDQELLSFDPYKILDLEVGAEPSVIKKAYKRMSLKYHPDKNQGNPDANNMFIAIAKAYETLTDDTARENWEKYGNPDGYQGKSVVIGLPSFLTNKENEKAVLLTYLLIILMLPPIIVGLWWMKASQFHESGVRAQTLQLYGSRFVAENTPLKNLIEILCASLEFEVPCRFVREDEIPFRKLHSRVEEHIMKPRLTPPDVFTYISKGITLLTAYMRRERIPKRFRTSLNYLLKHAHRLLDLLVDVTVARAMPNTKLLFVIFEFMQRITQATWIHDAEIVQLPHIENAQVGLLNRGAKKRISTLRQLRDLDEETRREKMSLTPQQSRDINRVLERLPFDIGAQASLHSDLTDKAGHVFREDDIIRLSVTVKREAPEWASAADDASPVLEEEDKDSVAASTSTSTSSKLSRKDKKKLKEQQAAEAEKNASGENSQVAVIGDTAAAADDDAASDKAEADAALHDDIDPDASDGEEEEKWWVKEKKPERNEAVIAHAPHFPFIKQERWYLLMIDPKTDRLYHYQKLASVSVDEEVEIKFRAPDKGKQELHIHLVSDSYTGLDYKLKVNFNIIPVPEETEEEAARKPRVLGDNDSDDDSDDDIDAEALLAEEEELEAKWYYLYLGGNFTEFMLSLFALGFLGMIAMTFLMSRGYWDSWVVPKFEAFMSIVRPYAKEYLKVEL